MLGLHRSAVRFGVVDRFAGDDGDQRPAADLVSGLSSDDVGGSSAAGEGAAVVSENRLLSPCPQLVTATAVVITDMMITPSLATAPSPIVSPGS